MNIPKKQEYLKRIGKYGACLALALAVPGGMLAALAVWLFQKRRGNT